MVIRPLRLSNQGHACIVYYDIDNSHIHVYAPHAVKIVKSDGSFILRDQITHNLKQESRKPFSSCIPSGSDTGEVIYVRLWL